MSLIFNAEPLAIIVQPIFLLSITVGGLQVSWVEATTTTRINTHMCIHSSRAGPWEPTVGRDYNNTFILTTRSNYLSPPLPSPSSSLPILASLVTVVYT